MSLVQRTFSYAVLSCLITTLSHNKCCLFLKQGFLTSVRGEEISPDVGNGKFCCGDIFLSGGGNLRRSYFDYSILYQS